MGDLPAIGSDAARLLAQTRCSVHRQCFACGEESHYGLRVLCAVRGDGAVEGQFLPEPWMQGYDGQLQGGIIATVLDSAMTQCLFARGVVAVTARMEVRFRRPAPLTGRYGVRAWLDDRRLDLYGLKAQLRCGEDVIADASAWFSQRRGEAGA